MERLQKMEGLFKFARKQYKDELLREYPEGTRVSMMLSSRQILPSTGVVIGPGDDGSLRVRIDAIGGMVRDIYWQDIISKRDGEVGKRDEVPRD